MFSGDYEQRRYAQVIAVAVAVFVMADAICLPFTNIRFGPGNATPLAVIGAIAFAYWLTARLMAWFSKRGSLPAITSKLSDVFDNIAIFIAVFMPLMISSCVFMYIGESTTRPLMDGYLVGIDRALGLDWVGAVAFFNGYPLIAKAFVFCYFALMYQLVFLTVWLCCVTGGRRRLLEFCAILAVSSIFTGAIMAAIPIDGPYLYLRPAPSLYTHFTNAGVSHAETVAALRSGQPFTFMINHMVGLVTMPSFHTALGIMVTYGFRRTPFVIPSATINAMMIVSTLPEGGHYLVDVIAGAALALASIYAVKTWARDGRRVRTQLLPSE